MRRPSIRSLVGGAAGIAAGITTGVTLTAVSVSTQMLVAAKFGRARDVPVFYRRTDNAAQTAKVTIKATSESDPTKSSVTTFVVSR